MKSLCLPLPPSYPHQVLAIDLDEGPNGWVTYRMQVGMPRMDFLINSTSGLIISTTVLDRERIAEYYLRVVASDAGTPSKSSTSTLTVKGGHIRSSPVPRCVNFHRQQGILQGPQNSQGYSGEMGREGGQPWGHSSPFPLAVLDVNDESPTFFPAIYNVSLPENVARDFKVVRLNCTDADVGLNAELSYFITGTAADPISLSWGAFHPDDVFPDCLTGGSGCLFQGCFPFWPSA